MNAADAQDKCHSEGKRRNLATLIARVGVRVYLFVFLSATAVLPVTVFAWSEAEQLAEYELKAADRQMLAATRAAAEEVALAIQGYVRAAETLSAHLGNMEVAEHEGLYLALQAHVFGHPEFLGTYVADAHGSSLAHLSYSGEYSEVPIDYSDRDYLKRLLHTKATTISRAALGRYTRTLAVQVVAPIADRSRGLLGFTCSSIDLATVVAMVKQSAQGVVAGRVLVVDRHGVRIADSRDESRQENWDGAKLPLYAPVPGGQAVTRTGKDDGQQVVRAVAVGLSSPIDGWRVITAVPQVTLDEQARRTKRMAFAYGAVLVAVAMILAGWLATIIARPLRALAVTANAITRGDLAYRLALSGFIPKEVVHLEGAMRAMVASLRGHALELEGQVAQRTKELVSANSELAGALALIRENDRRMQADIEQARIFQEKLLPRPCQIEWLEMAVHYAPLHRVSGDIFDICQVGMDTVRIFVADATGHGVQASMRTILLKSMYDRLKSQHSNPSALLAALNTLLVAEFSGSELHCTACCVDFRRVGAKLAACFANAGGPPLYVLSSSVPASEVYCEGPLLGLTEVLVPEPFEFFLEPGQALLVASDGLLEQWNPLRRRFDSVLSECVLETAPNAHSALSDLLAQFDRFRGEVPTSDDVTAIVIRVPETRL